MDSSNPPMYPMPTAKFERNENNAQGPPTFATFPNQTAALLGPENTVTVCQFCHASIRTAVKYTVTARTHIAAALWGMICCLCCVPYAADSAKNSDHYCPNCQRYLGTYRK
ncbi:unnamed protein product [Chilo suppressalis]|uniref:LITAF domain-containing protein n=1 Tax=Chilo suppressalis TaxID=168631 RepID=A0ABN8B8F3_CHISP|nr:unnamed protein product [Chilo suppressalis]